MAELKTKKNKASVEKFLDGVKDEKKREDSYTILKLMKQITKADPKMWGDSMIGFGNYHYKYASGREGDWFVTGFSPRKQNLTLYIMSGFSKYPELMKTLGKYKTGKSFQELLMQYSNLFMQALFFSVSLLFAIVVLVKGFSVITFSIIMLSISSVAIILKYIGLIREYRIIVFDGTVLLLNMFDIYFLIINLCGWIDSTFEFLPCRFY